MHGTRPTLRPPRRGDLVAGPLLLVAMVIFSASAFMLVRSGAFRMDGPASALPAINIASLVLSAVGFLWSVVRDLGMLRAEEYDIEYLLTSAEVQADPRHMLTRDRTSASRAIHTLLDDRVERVLGGLENGPAHRGVREGDLRAMAVARSSAVGSVARYLSTLLLLMTVLGTFIGVREAMPLLVTALKASSSGDANPTRLGDSLDLIGDAFGANLTALVGAITLGMAAFALALGRQHMLARLEQASSQYLYPKAEHATERSVLDTVGKALQAASADLGSAAESVSNAATRLATIDEGIGTLGASIGDLSLSVGESLTQTRDAIRALLSQQVGQVQEATHTAVDRIERQLTDTVVSVQHATSLYASLVDVMHEQRRVVDAAVNALSEVARESKEARTSFGQYVDGLSHTLDNRFRATQTVQEQLLVVGEKQLTCASATLERYVTIQEGVASLLAHAQAVVEKADDSERERQQFLSDLELRIARGIAERVEHTIAPLLESTRALQSGAAEMEHSISGLGGSLDSVGRVVTEGVAAGLRSAPVDVRVAVDNEQIGELVHALSQLVQTLERRSNLRLWRRMDPRRFLNLWHRSRRG